MDNYQKLKEVEVLETIESLKMEPQTEFSELSESSLNEALHSNISTELECEKEVYFTTSHKNHVEEYNFKSDLPNPTSSIKAEDTNYEKTSMHKYGIHIMDDICENELDKVDPLMLPDTKPDSIGNVNMVEQLFVCKSEADEKDNTFNCEDSKFDIAEDNGSSFVESACVKEEIVEYNDEEIQTIKTEERNEVNLTDMDLNYPVKDEDADSSMTDIKAQLIASIKEKPAIWKKSHLNHHNRYYLAKEWKKVAQEVGMTENGAKPLWKKLRQDFGRKLSKPKSGDSAPNEPINSWPYFESLMFLKDQFLPRESISNLDSEDGKAEENVYLDDDNLEDIIDVGVPEEEPPSASCEAILQQPGQTSTATTTSSHHIKVKTGYKKRVSPQIALGQSLLELEKEKIELKKAHATDPNDEDVGFFNSLLPYVRKLDLLNKIDFRMEVQHILDRKLVANERRDPHCEMYNPFISTLDTPQSFMSSQNSSTSQYTAPIGMQQHQISQYYFPTEERFSEHLYNASPRAGSSAQHNGK